jgi:precorrin-6x reductase
MMRCPDQQKNRAARELGIPVITEQQYLNMKQHPEEIPETPGR